MKDVFLVMLMTVAAVLGLILILAMPILLRQRHQDAREAIAPEAWETSPQRIWKIRPCHVWAACETLVIVWAVVKWADFPAVEAVAGAVFLPLLLVGFGWNVVWAGRVLLRRAELDGRLVKFAHSRFWSSLAVVVLLAACYASGF